MFEIRAYTGTKADYDFLTDMLYESIYISENKPAKHVLLQSEHLRKYHQDWGRQGDTAFIAYQQEDKAIGAAWYRLFDERNPGYGFVRHDIPELGIAITSGARGRGLGRELMNKLLQVAKTSPYPGLSLSVDPENTSAVKLYQSLGFVKVGEEGTSITMLILFAE
ncbi:MULTISPECIES: GNAT family N-acetyltransferase [Gracilibacillus]|uniref:GNAT family N-acetyltransferase n=1 Tax=Gracilibacillus TaxID=74385 RepID=UPI00098F2C38|nr:MULTISPECIES: GNAT family N-acetyltransferase [Gracilibacillus]